MPYSPLPGCRNPSCPERATHQGFCALHRQQANNGIATQPGTRLSTSQRGYGWKWQQARLRYLRAHPACTCGQPSTVIDHVTPHKGDKSLFWDEANWRGLCKPCHDRKTATEDGGFGNAARGWDQKSLRQSLPD